MIAQDVIHFHSGGDGVFPYEQNVERLEILLSKTEVQRDEDVKVQMVVQLVEQLEMPELCFEERLSTANQLCEALGMKAEFQPKEIVYSLDFLEVINL